MRRVSKASKPAMPVAHQPPTTISADQRRRSTAKRERRAEAAMSEGEGRDREHRSRSPAIDALVPLKPASCRQPLRDRCAEIERERIGHCDARDAGQPAHGHHRDDADHQEGDQRACRSPPPIWRSVPMPQVPFSAMPKPNRKPPMISAPHSSRAPSIDRTRQIEPAREFEQHARRRWRRRSQGSRCAAGACRWHRPHPRSRRACRSVRAARQNRTQRRARSRGQGEPETEEDRRAWQ